MSHLSDYKITSYEQNIVDLPNRPNDAGYSAAALKAFFDGRGDHELKESINGIITLLSSAAGANEVGITPIPGMSAETVQTALAELLEEVGVQVESIAYEVDANGHLIITLPDGTRLDAGDLTGPPGTPGADGVSPTVSVSKSGKITTITITDKNGTRTETITDGTDGTDGVSPTVSVSKSGKITTITITDKNGTRTETITDGTDGTDGVSPTVSVSKSGKITTITITDKNGTHTATITDGADGQGAGDMLAADYDAGSAVLNAGGIAAYVTGAALAKAAKVTSLSASSTDAQVPSAKCVWDMIGDVESTLEALL